MSVLENVLNYYNYSVTELASLLSNQSINQSINNQLLPLTNDTQPEILLNQTIDDTTECCSTRPSLKPRPVRPDWDPDTGNWSRTAGRENCTDDYAELFCLNEGTCWRTKIADIYFVNCDCGPGWYGRRCEYRDSPAIFYSSAHQMLNSRSIESASLSSCVTFFVVLCSLLSIVLYLHLRHKRRRRNRVIYAEARRDEDTESMYSIRSSTSSHYADDYGHLLNPKCTCMFVNDTTTSAEASHRAVTEYSDRNKKSYCRPHSHQRQSSHSHERQASHSQERNSLKSLQKQCDHKDHGQTLYCGKLPSHSQERHADSLKSQPHIAGHGQSDCSRTHSLPTAHSQLSCSLDRQVMRQRQTDRQINYSLPKAERHSNYSLRDALVHSLRRSPLRLHKQTDRDIQLGSHELSVIKMTNRTTATMSIGDLSYESEDILSRSQMRKGAHDHVTDTDRRSNQEESSYLQKRRQNATASDVLRVECGELSPVKSTCDLVSKKCNDPSQNMRDMNHSMIPYDCECSSLLHSEATTSIDHQTTHPDSINEPLHNQHPWSPSDKLKIWSYQESNVESDKSTLDPLAPSRLFATSSPWAKCIQPFRPHKVSHASNPVETRLLRPNRTRPVVRRHNEKLTIEFCANDPANLA